MPITLLFCSIFFYNINCVLCLLYINKVISIWIIWNSYADIFDIFFGLFYAYLFFLLTNSKGKLVIQIFKDSNSYSTQSDSSSNDLISEKSQYEVILFIVFSHILLFKFNAKYKSGSRLYLPMDPHPQLDFFFWIIFMKRRFAILGSR